MPCFKKVLLFFVLLMFLVVEKVNAACDVTVDNPYFSPGSNQSKTINVSNNGDTPITWVSIPINFSSFLTSIQTEIQDSGWMAMFGSDVNVFSGGAISPGNSVSFRITGDVSADEGSFDWNWQTSTDTSGNPTEDCNPLTFYVTNTPPEEPQAPDSTPPPSLSINNSTLSVGNNSAVLTWTTNMTATGTVNYGLTSSYGSILYSANGTSHSVSMTGLSPSTVYHYQISATGEEGNTITNDATFTTTEVGSTRVVTSTVTVNTTTTTTTTTTNLVTKILKDTVAPTINITTDFSKVFEAAPTVIGKIIDGGEVNAGIISADYSMDGGKNWLSVDDISDIGNKSTNFEFTPGRLDDGNYSVKLRAKDASGNVGMSKVFTLIIDRLPPQVGGGLFSLGPMILRPDPSGKIYTIAGMETTTVLSAVGGPTSIDLLVDSQKFALIKNEESGLWKGTIKTDRAGIFKLKTKSIDGAKNETERNLSTLISLSPGKTEAKAKIKVYTFEKSLNDFVLWDASPYMQNNPIETDENGEYQLILPAGKYFLEVEATGKRKIRTEIFNLDLVTPVNQDFKMEKKFLWDWWADIVPIKLTGRQQERMSSTLVGRAIPDFDLSYQDNLFSSTSILGRPTVITFVSTWEPQTSDQLIELDQFKAENSGINVMAVAVQESISKMDIFKKNGGYKVPLIADADGILVTPLGLESLPTHIFIDRKGIIKSVDIGLLNKYTLLEKILN